jgi:hypothetical protein
VKIAFGGKVVNHFCRILLAFLVFFVALQLEIKKTTDEIKQKKHFRREITFGVMIT